MESNSGTKMKKSISELLRLINVFNKSMADAARRRRRCGSGNCLPLRGGYPGALFVAEIPFPRVAHSLSQSVDQSRLRREENVQGNGDIIGKVEVKEEAK